MGVGDLFGSFSPPIQKIAPCLGALRTRSFVMLAGIARMLGGMQWRYENAHAASLTQGILSEPAGLRVRPAAFRSYRCCIEFPRREFIFRIVGPTSFKFLMITHSLELSDRSFDSLRRRGVAITGGQVRQGEREVRLSKLRLMPLCSS